MNEFAKHLKFNVFFDVIKHYAFLKIIDFEALYIMQIANVVLTIYDEVIKFYFKFLLLKNLKTLKKN
jgi:hypothetical protein